MTLSQTLGADSKSRTQPAILALFGPDAELSHFSLSHFPNGHILVWFLVPLGQKLFLL